MKSTAAAFLSYAHFDDEHSGGRITEFGRRLGDEIRSQTGEVFSVFQDREHLEWGSNWSKHIDEAIGGATFLIPVLTPSFFKSRACREETERFLRRREELSHNELVLLPLYFIDESLINDEAVRANDPLAQAIATYQYADWRDLRFANPNSAMVGKALENLAKQIRSTLGRIHGTIHSARSSRLALVSINPDDVSIGRLPVTGPKLYGRDAELSKLDEAWENRKTNIVSLVAWGGVGKSALVNHWLVRMREKNYRGARKVFGWSFYTQGTSDEASSADPFFVVALKWFGDSNPEVGNPEEKGARLAKLVEKHRTLLILDGLEPLQYGPKDRQGKGRLKHPGIRLLLRELASHNTGLCVVSSRLPLTDLNDFSGSTMQELSLQHLSPAAGVQLLKSQGAYGPEDEMERASVEYGGHALTLSILGHFVKMAAGGDIRQRDRIGPLTSAPEGGDHARRAVGSIERWFETRRAIGSVERWFENDPDKQVELESLRLMGLFDRPVEPYAWKALIAKPAIKGLTGHISNATERRWRSAIGVLREARLLAERDEDSPDTIDCHPLIRQYFSEELQKKHPKRWKEAHQRLFDFFYPKRTEPPKTVEEMAPYYQAITHACLAGRHREAFYEVYMPYIRQDRAYNTDTLRAFADDLAALSRFLNRSQHEVVAELDDRSSFILGEIGFDLRALGRLDEAIESMSAALAWDKAPGRLDRWHRINAARQADILSTTYLIGGHVRDALRLADEAVDLANDDPYHKMICLTTRADAKHRAGDLDGAKKDFWQAESINKIIFSDQKWHCLRSFQGFRYCDYFLTVGSFTEIYRRVRKTLVWDEHGGYPSPSSSIPLHALQTEGSVLPVALDHLMFARALLVEGPKNRRRLKEAEAHLNNALSGIRDSATRHLWPRALLVRAQWLRAKGETKEAEETLQHCLAICERDKMKLYEADCHFEFACLYLEEAAQGKAMNSLKRAMDELTLARKMSERVGYGLLRRKIARIEGDD
jgi:tetratricopeptide (TPR) repeat protein